MKSRILLMWVAICCLQALSFAYSPNKEKEALPKFGSIEKSDLTASICEYEENAAAEILVDEMAVTFEKGNKGGFRLVMNVRRRIKILSAEGLDEANIKLKYYDFAGYEFIRKIEANTYNLDNQGNIVKTTLNKNDIRVSSIDDKRKEIAFNLPQVKVGSIIEYRYIKTDEAFDQLPGWFFQDKHPVRNSYFEVIIPEYFTFSTKELITKPVIRVKDGQLMTLAPEWGATSGTLFSWQMNHLTSINKEPFGGNPTDYTQHIRFQLEQIEIGSFLKKYKSTWPMLGKELMENESFGLQIKKNIEDEVLDILVKSAPNELAKAELIYNYVRTKMSFDGRAGIYVDNIKTAWAKKNGSVADINLILLSLYRKYGITAYPILASTHGHGLVYPNIPFLQQFNEVIVMVSVNDNRYIVDATSQGTPFNTVPLDVNGSHGLVISGPEIASIIPLWTNTEKQKTTSIYLAEIDNHGALSGDFTNTYYDYSKNEVLSAISRNGDGGYINKYLLGKGNNMVIDTISYNRKDSLQSITNTFTVQGKFKGQLNITGEYLFFTPYMLTDLNENPFTAASRNSPIIFGSLMEYNFMGSTMIPENYEVEALPKNIKMIMPDSSIVLTRISSYNDGVINSKIQINFLSPVYEPREYADIRDFYKKLFAALSEQIVLKKKK